MIGIIKFGWTLMMSLVPLIIIWSKHTIISIFVHNYLKMEKDIVQILIDKGASINTKNEYGFTALMLASSNGHKDIVELLIDKGADIDAKMGLIQDSESDEDDDKKVGVFF